MTTYQFVIVLGTTTISVGLLSILLILWPRSDARPPVADTDDRAKRHRKGG